MGRAGVWYTDHITVKNSIIEAPRNFRRCHDVTLRNVDFPNAAETLWNCNEVILELVTARGDYSAMNSQNIKLYDFQLVGNYSFDGEYLGWNAKNLTLINCTIES